MTSQLRDRVRFDGRDWELALQGGCPLFHPGVYGIEQQVFVSTADARGFSVVYEVTGGRLQVHTVNARCCPTKAISGVEPLRTEDGSLRWSCLSAPWPLSGVFVLGAVEPRELAYCMPFLVGHFARVTELRFRAGHLVATIDRTADVAAIRSAAMAFRLSPDEDREIVLARRRAQLAPATARFEDLLDALAENDYTLFPSAEGSARFVDPSYPGGPAEPPTPPDTCSQP